MPGLGVLFGMYYQMEILKNNNIYSKVLPTKLGFKTFAESKRTNPIHIREADGETYVRIYKKDGFKLRWKQQMDWVDKMNAETARKAKK